VWEDQKIIGMPIKLRFLAIVEEIDPVWTFAGQCNDFLLFLKSTTLIANIFMKNLSAKYLEFDCYYRNI